MPTLPRWLKGLIWDDDSRALAEAIEYGFTHSMFVRPSQATTDRAKPCSCSWAFRGSAAKHNLPVVWATASGRLAEANIEAVIQIWQAAKIVAPKDALQLRGCTGLQGVGVFFSSCGHGQRQPARNFSSCGGFGRCLRAIGFWLEQETYREELWHFYSVDLSSRLTKCGNKPSQNMIVVNQRLASAQGDLLDMIMQSSRGAAKSRLQGLMAGSGTADRHPSEEWHNQDHYSR